MTPTKFTTQYFKLQMTRQEAFQMTRKVLIEHGLGNWEIVLLNSYQRIGVCRHYKKVIGLSKHFIEHNSRERVMETVLHEVAHALVGPGHGHNIVWQNKAREIGLKRIAACAETTDTVMPTPYFAICDGCNYEHRMVRKTKSAYKCKCGHDSILKFQAREK